MYILGSRKEMYMKKLLFLIVGALMLASCTTTDYTGNLAGVSDNVTIVVKNFITLGIVTVQSREVHYSGAFGFVKNIKGSKITYADLLQEASKLEADDIINVRIDMHSDYKKGVFDWITGWVRTYTYTGSALAIKYTDMMETESDPQLGGLPKTPEKTRASARSR